MDGKHFGYYKKKTYTKSRSILQAISKKTIDRNTKIVERVPYDIYWRAVAFHQDHSEVCNLYVLQVSPYWIEIELVIN